MIAIQKNPLSILSDSQLIEKLHALVEKERETTLEVLRHIIEFDRRKLYLGIGYGSLFEYCTRHLGYSESAAQRRIKAARCIHSFPELFDMLIRNEIGLSVVCRLSGVLNTKNKKELLKSVRFRSAREVEDILARYRPTNDLPDRARPVYIKKPAELSVAAGQAAVDVIKNSNSQNAHSAIMNQAHSAAKSAKIFTADVGGKIFATSSEQRRQSPVLTKKFKLEFTVDPEFMKKLDEAKALISGKYPAGVTFEMLFEEMLDEYLEKHSPEQKKQRREERQAKQESKKTTNPSCNHNNSQRSRHIPQAVRDKVYARDNGRCTFIGPDGVRCNSTWNLHIDHIIPYARGGDHSISNLRLLCAKHNHLEAENKYGRDFMKRKKRAAIPMRK